MKDLLLLHSCNFGTLFILSHVHVLYKWTVVDSGERTFGVLTKIDLMDKGTDAVDVSLYDFKAFARYLIAYCSISLLEKSLLRCSLTSLVIFRPTKQLTVVDVCFL
jgi:hypothetical protein